VIVNEDNSNNRKSNKSLVYINSFHIVFSLLQPIKSLTNQT